MDTITIDFLHIKEIAQKVCKEYHIFYVIRGELRLYDFKQNIHLHEGDIILLMPGQKIQIAGNKTHLLMDVVIPVSLLKDLPISNTFLKGKHQTTDFVTGNFVCNSAVDKQHDYVLLRKLLLRMAVVSSDKSVVSGIFFQSLTYMLVYVLWNNYYDNSNYSLGEDKDTLRKTAVLHYIQENYSEELRLEDLAKHLNLSPSYISRYIKDIFGENFVTLLKKWRVEHSLTDLLYGEKTITDIAANHGFSSSNAYIQAFKDIYNITPNLYRKNYHQTVFEETADISDYSVQKNVSLPLLASESLELSALLDEMNVFQKEHYIIDVHHGTETIKTLWNQALDIASSHVFMFNDIYSGIQDVQKNIGFKYGKVSFALSGNMLSLYENDKQYYFYHFERLIQTFLDQGMLPYIDINYDRSSYIFGEHGESIVDEERFKKELTDLMDHWIYSFGEETMANWIFDIGMLSNMLAGSCEDYISFSKRYIWAHQMIKKRIPKSIVGGFDIMPQLFMTEIPKILDILLERDIVPDFISIHEFPYEATSDGNGNLIRRYSSDPSFILKNIKELKKILEGYRLKYKIKPQIFINSMGTTIAHRNYIDDTCYQATFFVKNIIDLIGEVDLISFFQMCDFNFTLEEKHVLLNGRNGLLAQFGLKKPGYIAFEMMKRLSDQMVAKGDGYLITREKNDSYVILMCNHIGLSDWYCEKIEESLALKDVYNVFEKMDIRNLSFTLNGVKNGEYRLLSYHLNRENGSLFDEWGKIDFLGNPNANELEYLRSVLHPKRNSMRRTSTDNCLDIQMHLQPFEVVVMEVTYIE